MTRIGVHGGPARQVIRPGVAGLRRHILIKPRPGCVTGELEDDFHHFRVELRHDGARILAVETTARRHPWTLCADAGPFLARRLEGAMLAQAEAFDSQLSHCTHQYDLALLAAAHASEREPTLFSMLVEDSSGAPRVAELRRNGEPALVWRLDGETILPPSPWHGLSLRRLREWLPQLDSAEQEAAKLLRRAVFISGGRRLDLVRTSSADKMNHRMGACYVYQPERASLARLTATTKDFSSGDEAPLAEGAAAAGF